ncbi:zinc finger FYVE domain-containing protein 21-like [Limulus polyphemus]|uniref:Zinc finger FYVE domain-containing protein 21-like n=1 Tax=Limulus polyphemus TaxID=6850 RepID=A0ABM1BLS2_LIMPO|nr:zinc finger FYVE domain-containing protein 21-like [Limulus polyphemus]
MSSTATKYLVKSKSGLRIVCGEESRRSPFELSEPPWMPDEEKQACIKCKIKFDFLTRRHHCRRCGKIFCGNCCGKKLALQRMCFVDPVRLCALCAEVTLKENEFYEKHLKTLQNGANFHVKSVESILPSQPVLHLCKLSSDHRELYFGGAKNSLERVELNKIVELKIVRSESEYPGLTVVTGVELIHEISGQGICSVILSDNANSKQSRMWISALQKAFKMVLESRGSSVL